MKDYEGCSDREILVAIAEKVETLFVFVNDQKICNTGVEERVRNLQIHGAGISQQNAKDVEEIKKDIVALKEFKTFFEGMEKGTKEVARNTATIYSLIIGVSSVVGNIVITFILPMLLKGH